MGARERDETITRWITWTVSLLGWGGVVLVLVDDAFLPRYVSYLIGLQAGAAALGSMITSVSLTTAALARDGYEVAGSLCTLLGAVPRDDTHRYAHVGIGRPLRKAPPLLRAMAHPAAWKGAGYVAVAAEAVCLTAIYLALHRQPLYPVRHEYILAAIITGLVPTCGSIRIAGARQQKALAAVDLAVSANRQLRELLRPAEETRGLRLMPQPAPLHVGRWRHHTTTKQTADGLSAVETEED